MIKQRHLSFSLNITLSTFKHFVEKSERTVLQKLLLLITFLISKLPKYNFLAVLRSLLHKLHALLLYFNLPLEI